MAFRRYFLLVSVLVSLHYHHVPDVSDTYAVKQFQFYRNINRTTLYDFVAHVESVSKVLAGRVRRTRAENGASAGNPEYIYFTILSPPGGVDEIRYIRDPTITILLRVVEHRPMGYVALESIGTDPILQLRVEFHFCRGRIRTNGTGSGPFCAPTILGKSDQFGAAAGDHPCASEPGSGLGVKIYFRQASFLFQNTIGAVLRTVIKRQLNHSLHNLHHILPHVERSYGVLS